MERASHRSANSRGRLTKEQWRVRRRQRVDAHARRAPGTRSSEQGVGVREREPRRRGWSCGAGRDVGLQAPGSGLLTGSNDVRSLLIGMLTAALILAGLTFLAAALLLVFPYVGSRLRGGGAGGDTPTLVSASAARGESVAAPTAAPELPGRGAPFFEGAGLDTALQDAALEASSPTRLRIPSLKLDAPIVPVEWSLELVDGREVRVWEVPEGGHVGWHDGSALLGEPGNTVLNGHNTTGGEVFRNLYTMEVGDTLTLYGDSKPYTYVVSSTLVVPEAGEPWDVRMQNASLLEHTPDERVTLVTCHPYGSLQNRLFVVAVPTSPDLGAR